jgi:hypothetical protein
MSRLTMRTVPSKLLHATRFSDDASNNDPFALINWAKQFPDVIAEFEKLNRKTGTRGPRRMQGNWGLIYMCYVTSDVRSLKRWHDQIRHDWRLWKACGFKVIPGYDTVWRRFGGSEQFIENVDSSARVSHYSGESP